MRPDLLTDRGVLEDPVGRNGEAKMSSSTHKTALNVQKVENLLPEGEGARDVTPRRNASILDPRKCWFGVYAALALYYSLSGISSLA